MTASGQASEPIDWQREKWQSGLGSKFIHQGEKNAAKYADEVIVLSKGVQKYFLETYGRRLDYRSKKKMNVPMRDWVIVDNTHEAIIPAEQFELVRRILETETRRPNDAETVALFAGFLYCGDCGSRLVRRSASYKGKRYIYYQCSGSKQNKGSCTSHMRAIGWKSHSDSTMKSRTCWKNCTKSRWSSMKYLHERRS